MIGNMVRLYSIVQQYLLLFACYTMYNVQGMFFPCFHVSMFQRTVLEHFLAFFTQSKILFSVSTQWSVLTTGTETGNSSDTDCVTRFCVFKNTAKTGLVHIIIVNLKSLKVQGKSFNNGISTAVTITINTNCENGFGFYKNSLKNSFHSHHHPRHYHHLHLQPLS